MNQRLRLTISLLTGLVLCAPPSAAEQRLPARDEETVKAAVIVKLIQFVSWPEAALPPPGKPVSLCVLEKDRWIPLLRQTVQGESLNDHPIVVSRITKAREANQCQILVVGGPIERESMELWQSAHVLTISDEDSFGSHTSMVSLNVASGRMRFELNLDLAQKAHLRFSAKLLQLAQVVLRSQG